MDRLHTSLERTQRHHHKTGSDAMSDTSSVPNTDKPTDPEDVDLETGTDPDGTPTENPAG